MLNYLHTTVVSCVYIIYVCAHASSASRPPTGRTIHTSPSLALTNGSAFGELLLLFGIAELTRLQLPKCNNHLVSFIKVDGLSVSYIVIIFTTIKSRTLVYRSMECRHFYHRPLNHQERGLSFYGVSTFLSSLNQERWSIALWIVNIFVIIKSRTVV